MGMLCRPRNILMSMGGACRDYSCLRCCGICLYWLPRVSIPLSIVWGTLSHIVYSCELSSRLVGFVVSVIGSVAGILAFVAYVQIWYVGAGSSTEFPELVVRDPEAQVGVFSGGVPDVMQDSVEAKRDGGVRFCSKCQCFKPDRTHHCRQCGICILRMDHHCPWFSTCVGFRNHKFFIQFLWYVFVLCCCAQSVALPRLIEFFRDDSYQTEFIGVNFVFYLIMSAMFTVVLLGFGGYTTWLAVGNRTTLESLEPTAYRTSLPAKDWRYRHPPTRENLGNIYDLGTRANLEQIMGTTWIDWLLPIRSNLRLNGLSFPVNEELRAKGEERAQTEIALHQRKRQWQSNQMLQNGSTQC